MNVQGKVANRPCCPWPEDENRKELGRLQGQNILIGWEGASTMLSMKHLGCTKQEVEAIIEEARKDLSI